MLSYGFYLLALLLQLALLALATDLLAGHCGRLGLSAVFFAGLGGYTYAILTTQTGLGVVAAVIAAIVAPSLVAAIVGPVLMRMEREVFLLASLGLVLTLGSTATNLGVTRGPLGIPAVPAPVAEIGPVAGSLMLLVPLTILVVFGIVVVLRYGNKIRRACHSVRDDELAATITGLAPSNVLLPAFVVHAGIASLAGVGVVTAHTYIGPATFDIGLAISVITVVIVSGPGAQPHNALIAAFLVIAAEEVLAAIIHRPTLVGPSQRLLFNLALLVLLVLRPRGIAGPVIQQRTDSSLRL